MKAYTFMFHTHEIGSMILMLIAALSIAYFMGVKHGER